MLLVASKQKTMCKLGPEGIQEQIGEIIAQRKKPKVICQRCGRVARKKKLVCKPAALRKPRPSACS
jgi:hypothetical protein